MCGGMLSMGKFEFFGYIRWHFMSVLTWSISKLILTLKYRARGLGPSP